MLPSSEPVTTTCAPCDVRTMLLTKDECPRSFLTLCPVSASHAAPYLSTDADSTIVPSHDQLTSSTAAPWPLSTP